MTIEQTLRNDHETLRGLVRRLANDGLRTSSSSRELLNARIRAEWLAHSEARETIAYRGVPYNSIESLANTDDRKRIESLLKSEVANTDVAHELAPLFERQFELERVRLLPALRSTYSTDEREELGEIFLEVKSEIRESLKPRAERSSWFQPGLIGERILGALKFTRI